MQISQTHQLNHSELNQLVKLHTSQLHESFLNNLGSHFLYILYKTIIESDNTIFLIAKNEDIIIGYAAATKNNSIFQKEVIFKNIWKLTLIILKNVFIRPRVVYKIIQWSLTSSPNRIAPSELQFIAIDTPFQNQGIGSRFIEKLSNVYKMDGISKYCVGTKANNITSNNFYIKKGFKFVSRFQLFGDEFNYYISPKLF